MSESGKIISEAQAKGICEELLRAYGAPGAEAKAVAEVLVAGSLRGVDSHGLQLLPRYLIRIERGLVRPGAKVEVVREGPATALVDGGMGLRGRRREEGHGVGHGEGRSMRRRGRRREAGRPLRHSRILRDDGRGEGHDRAS
jgi:hypothetical protein